LLISHGCAELSKWVICVGMISGSRIFRHVTTLSFEI